MTNLPTRVDSTPIVLNRKGVESIERKAANTYLKLQHDTVRFCAYLRQLQRADAHLIRGFTNFGKYAEATFEGMGAVNAGALSRQGEVILQLEEHGRISLENKDSLPGTTGVRALAVILKRHGVETMLKVYDQAMESDRKITAETVQASTGLLLRPAPVELEEPEALDVESEDEDEDESEPEHSAKVQELIDRIRDLAYDLPESMGELEETTTQLKAELEGDSSESDKKWIESKR